MQYLREKCSGSSRYTGTSMEMQSLAVAMQLLLSPRCGPLTFQTIRINPRVVFEFVVGAFEVYEFLLCDFFDRFCQSLIHHRPRFCAREEWSVEGATAIHRGMARPHRAIARAPHVNCAVGSVDYHRLPIFVVGATKHRIGVLDRKGPSVHGGSRAGFAPPPTLAVSS